MNRFQTPAVAVAAAALAATFGTAASAQFSYVDAVAGANTLPANAFATGIGNDDLWGFRARGEASLGSIYQAEANGAEDEDAPIIITTITGLAAGTDYNVNVHFYDATQGESTQAWAIQAGLAADSLTLFSAAIDNNDENDFNGTATDAPLASSLTYTGVAPSFGDGNTIVQHAADLGVATADAGGNINVFVDDVSLVNNLTDARAWYDGVSYEAVPEPASLALVGLGGLALLGRRRG